MAVHAFPYWHPTIEQNELAIEQHKSLQDRLQIEATKRLKFANSKELFGRLQELAKK